MRVLSVALGLLLTLVAVTAAQAASYLLRPGDTLSVSVWQDSKLDRQVVVGPDGTISFPLAGHLRVGGQTLQAVESALRSKLQPNYQTDLDVTVSLASTQATTGEDTIFVTGEVNRPGSYPLLPPHTNAVQAIALSGGFSPYAATRRILIYRTVKGQQLRFTFNYRDYESGRDLSGNIDLRAGDLVVVPERGLFGY